MHRGVYVLAEIPDSVEVRFDAVRLLHSSAVASHHTAARLRSLPVPDTTETHVTVPDTENRTRIAGVRAHRAPVSGDVRTVQTRPALSVERTLCDLAGTGASLIDLVIFGDAAVRRGWTKPPELVTRAEVARGRGCALSRRAAGFVRPRVDSPMETRLRLLLVLAGLPEPLTNRPVHDETGWIATPDLSYPDYRIAIEYDGDHHRTDRRQWRHDKARSRRLRDCHWDLLECTADDVNRTPGATLAWVHQRLLRAGHPGTPAVVADAWRAHWA